MSDTATTPYADTYQAYWDAGWRGILPLPPGKKWPPPTGYTGRDGTDVSFADCWEWAEQQPHANIAIRLPDTVVGLDVDAYDNKPGATTLTTMVEAHGPLPPTVLSTSRGDGISGIRLYRVPPGTQLIESVPGIDLIQHHHRYAVVAPSTHPEGGHYTWIDEATGELITTPQLHQLPHLPDNWVTALTNTTPNTSDKADLSHDQAATLLTNLPTGDPCRHILAAAGHALAGGDRHDAYTKAQLAVLGRGRDGCPGAPTALKRLRSAFLAEISDRATPSEAAAEWARGLRGATALVATQPLGPGVCPDTLIPTQTTPTDTPTDTPPTTTPDPIEQAYNHAVAVKTRDLKILADAKQQLATLETANTPGIDPIHLDTFLTQPDLPTHYRVDQLWPAEGRVLLVAAAKTGKTTMVGRNLIPALLDGGYFLGRFETPATTRNILYLNMEVSENTLRAWMRTTRITNTQRLVVANLRGRSSALQLATPQGRNRFARFLTDHDIGTVILDPLAPVLASLGLVEDSNSDVARFFAWWSEALADGGVDDDLICHHAGHAGQRSRGASRLLDEPDAIWTITRQQGADPGEEDDLLPTSDHRFLTAYGRDVELSESALDYDGSNGLLSLLNVSARQLRRDHEQARYDQIVRNEIRTRMDRGDRSISLRDIVKQGANEGKLKQALERLIRLGEVIRYDAAKGSYHHELMRKP